MLVYLHGFRSSPQSFKARLLEKALARVGLADEFCCPQLPVSPAQAIELLRSTIPLTPDDTLVGSSLGGYYATWLAERSGCRAVLINPVVYAARDLASQVGDHRTWHDDQPMIFHRRYLRELVELETPAITYPERYLLIAARGDEVLDWHDMVDHYRDSQTVLLPDGDHGLSDFAAHMDRVLRFAGLGEASQGEASTD